MLSLPVGPPSLAAPPGTRVLWVVPLVVGPLAAVRPYGGYDVSGLAALGIWGTAASVSRTRAAPRAGLGWGFGRALGLRCCTRTGAASIPSTPWTSAELEESEMTYDSGLRSDPLRSPRFGAVLSATPKMVPIGHMSTTPVALYCTPPPAPGHGSVGSAPHTQSSGAPAYSAAYRSDCQRPRIPMARMCAPAAAIARP